MVGSDVLPAGGAHLPLRLMIALLYLRHAFNESEECVVERWAEFPAWQYFSGLDCFEHRSPCGSAALVHFRKALGEEEVEALLHQTIHVAVTLKLISKPALSIVIIDSMIQHKAITYLTYSRELATYRARVVEAAKGQGLELKQTFAKEAGAQTRRAGQCVRSKQYKRLRRVNRRQHTIVGRQQRQIDVKLSVSGQAVRATMNGTLLRSNESSIKLMGRRPKTECLRCIAGIRLSFAASAKVPPARRSSFEPRLAPAKGNLVVGARASTAAPVDRQTLREKIAQVKVLMQEIGVKPTTAVMDLRYRGLDAANSGLVIIHRGKAKSMDAQGIKFMKIDAHFQVEKYLLRGSVIHPEVSFDDVESILLANQLVDLLVHRADELYRSCLPIAQHP